MFDYSSYDGPGEQSLRAREWAGSIFSLRHVILEFVFTVILSDSRSDGFQAG